MVVVALGAVAGSSAELRASCGDYLRHTSAGLGEWRLGEVVPERLPCHGPGCSKSKSPLQLPIAPVFQFSFEERGWLSTSVGVELTSAAAPMRRLADADRGPDPQRDRLERPPQSL